jgi:hypothetical protein
MIEEEYWANAAKQLHRLLLRMPGVTPSDLQVNGTMFLATYIPPQGSWDDATENLRQSFVIMPSKQFNSILETYLRLHT